MRPRHIALVALVAWNAIAVACSTVNGESQEHTMALQPQTPENLRPSLVDN
jgi:hypothetical protein